MVESAKQDGIEGPPDGTPFASGIASWEGFGTDALRSGLVVPLGEGSLAVYSRLPDAFDAEAVELLTAIARRAEPAVQNAFRYLEAQHLAATDSRTGLGSASAFEEALPRELSAARRHGRPLCLIQVDLDDFGAINKRARGSLDDGNAALSEFGERVRGADPRQRHGLPELGRRGRVLPDPPRDDPRGGEAALQRGSSSRSPRRRSPASSRR